MWIILKVFIKCVTVSFLFYVLFGHEACRISAPQAGLECAPPALGCTVSTTDHRESLGVFDKPCRL